MGNGRRAYVLELFAFRPVQRHELHSITGAVTAPRGVDFRRQQRAALHKISQRIDPEAGGVFHGRERLGPPALGRCT